MTQSTKHQSKGVVIIDEDPVILQVFEKMLSRYHCHTTTLRGAKDWQTVLAQGDTRLIIMDIKYPGVQETLLLQSIKEHRKEVVIIAMTAYSNLIRPSHVRAMGADAYLTKPFDMGELHKIVEAYL